MFTRTEFDHAKWIATSSNAHVLLEELYDRGHQRPGRKVVTAAAFLVGLLLTCQEYGHVKLNKVARVLRSLPTAWLQELGMNEIDEAQIYRYSANLTRASDYSYERAPKLADSDRKWRRDQMVEVTHALIEATLITRPSNGKDYAIDSTGIWSNRLGDSQREALMAEPEREDQDAVIEAANESAHSVLNPTWHEASWGYKTKKAGGSEKFFGFDVHALIRVGERANDVADHERTEPNLVEAISVVAAGTDVVDPTLSILDRVLRRGQQIRYLFADRHYTYKKASRWRIALSRLGIKPIGDMHQSDQGFRLHDGIPWAAGQPHCPRVPTELGSIPALAPNASSAQREMFEHKIEERFRYAAKIHTPLDSHGKARFQCPALDNKIGCPRREGTLAMAMQEGLPIIQNPPEDPSAPRICTKQTFLVDIEEDPQIRDLMKNHQNPIWGTREWRKLYRRRTYIEGWFGTVKDTVGLKRRSIRLNGIAMNFLAISIYASLANRRHLQKWHQDTGLGPRTHPLLSESQEGVAEAA